MFDLLEDFSDVDADDAQHEDDESREKPDGDDEARPTGDGLPDDGCPNGQNQGPDKGQKRDREAQLDHQAERLFRKGNDDAQSQADEFAHRVGGPSASACSVLDVDNGRSEPHPADHGRKIAQVFPHRQHGADRFTGVNPEIGDRGVLVRFGQIPEEGIEGPGGQSSEDAIVADGPPGQDDIETLAGFGVKQREGFGEVLKVTVHDDDPVACGPFEAGCDGCVLAEIPAELDTLHSRILPADLFNARPGGVRAAVLDKDDFKTRGQRPDNAGQAVVERGQTGLGAEDGDDDAEMRIVHGRFASIMPQTRPGYQVRRG